MVSDSKGCGRHGWVWAQASVPADVMSSVGSRHCQWCKGEEGKRIRPMWCPESLESGEVRSPTCYLLKWKILGAQTRGTRGRVGGQGAGSEVHKLVRTGLFLVEELERLYCRPAERFLLSRSGFFLVGEKMAFVKYLY